MLDKPILTIVLFYKDQHKRLALWIRAVGVCLNPFDTLHYQRKRAAAAWRLLDQLLVNDVNILKGVSQKVDVHVLSCQQA